MRTSTDIKDFCARLGYEFDQVELLIEALTHPSLSSPTRPDNQRLEFLGDRVLGLAIAEILLERDKKASEGKIAPRFNALVRKETCAVIADNLELGPVLRLGRSEMLSGGRNKQALLGDAMEAVLAAIYLDSNFEITKKIINRLGIDQILKAKEDARDSKTALQEWAQSLKYAPPTYTELSRSGPDHGPIFTIEVSVESGGTAIASSSSKRNAQQAAAKSLLEKILNG